MPKIAQTIVKLGITKAQFSKLYKQVTGEKLDAKEKDVSADVLKQIQAVLNETDDGSSKVLKIEEFDTEENGFLSGLGFEKEEEKPAKEEKVEKDNFFEFQTNSSVTVSLEKGESYKGKFAKKERRNQKSVMDGRQEIDFYKKQFQQSSTPKPKPQQHGIKSPVQIVKAPIKAQPKQEVYEKEKTVVEVIKPVAIKKEVVAPRGSDTLKAKTEITISDSITVKEFSEKMGITLPDVMKKLLMNKIVVSANASIDFETASLIGEEFGVKVVRSSASVSVEDILSSNLQSILSQDKEEENLQERPPVVTIMGHVDHGKTKLLDYIRKTNIVAGEAGGITQSIGASQVIHNGKKITFIDTPGHELFTQLRARGSRITDIAIIVVAADDGVKQQTVEAIHHAKEAGVPIIVAITKIDKPHTKIEIIKGQLAENGLTPEDWGGDIPLIQLSAMTGQGVEDLMEVILLQAEILALKYNPARPGVGVVLEAHKDVKKGVTTSLILMTGSLKLGDVISIHNTYGKVKKMVDWKGADVKQVNGGDPVMILGLPVLPEPGRVAEVMKNEKEANAKVSIINDKEKQMAGASTMQNVMEMISKGEKVVLKLILKADSWGSHEALKFAISKVALPENIDIKIIHSDIGNITEGDLSLASASAAIVIGFNISLNAVLAKKAESQKIVVKCFDIIYEIMDYVDNLAKGLVKIEAKEVFKGKLQVLGCFFRKANDMIIGGKVIEGKAMNGVQFKLHRGEEVLGIGRVTSLKKENDNVDEIGTGYECGLKVKFGKKIEVDDILEFFVME